MSGGAAKSDLLIRVDEYIGRELEEVEVVFRDELRSRESFIMDILAHASHFRGKRLRPMLLLLVADACGGINDEHKTLAAVVEMIHTATLVHDDVLDDAATRRHVATVNTRWNTESSVLFGDYLFTHAFHLASSLSSTLACRLIGRATNIVCEGELAQIHQRGNLDLTEEEYLQIIDGKTAELCAVSCRLGAHFAAADSDVVDALEEYGRNLGLAFQIADDILDIVGNESQTGKSLRSDLDKQKLTLPLIRLLSQAAPDDAAQIRGLLAEPDSDTWHALQPYLQNSDAIEYSLAKAGLFATAGREQLEVLPASPGRQILEELLDFASQRTY